MHVTEGSSSNTRCIREVGHASRRRERPQRLEEKAVIPPRRRGARGRHDDVEHQPEQENMVDDVDVQQMEEQELEAMDEEMEDAEPRRRRKKKKKKKKVVVPCACGQEGG